MINGPINDDCDLAGYHARFGDNGMRELLGKQRAVLEGLAIRKIKLMRSLEEYIIRENRCREI